MSSLSINTSKTQLLCICDNDLSLQTQLLTTHTDPRDCSHNYIKHLGIYIGPGAPSQNWKENRTENRIGNRIEFGPKTGLKTGLKTGSKTGLKTVPTPD